MKKVLSYALALVALSAIASCTKEMEESVPENSTLRPLTVEATIPSVSGEGMKTAFSEKDMLTIRFADADNQFVGAPQYLKVESVSGKTAVFSSKKVAIRDDAASLVIYLDNKETNKVNYGSVETWCHLGSQKGTLEDAVAHQVILAKVPASSISSDKVSVDLAYKTAIVKIEVSFPADTELSDKDGNVIVPTFTLSSASQFNDIHLDLDEPTAKSLKGNLVVPASKVDHVAKTATAYVAVWPQADDFKESSFIARVGTTLYGSDMSGTKFSAGKSAVLKQTVETRLFNIWLNDDQNVISDVLGNVVETVSWISKEGKNIVVAKNTTGNMRSGSIVLDNGITYTVTQLGPNMFKGNWTLKSRRFNPNGSAPGDKGTTSAHQQSVTFGEALRGEPLTAMDGKTHTNNIGITGLYGDAVLDACVEIDYTARTIKFGIFFDRRSAQSDGNGRYVVFLPECASNAFTWSGYNFAPGTGVFSSTDYDWLWFDISEDFKTLKYIFIPDGQLTANGKYAICGISCVKAGSTEASSIGGSYDVIYQANYNGANAEGLSFIR